MNDHNHNHRAKQLASHISHILQDRIASANLNSVNADLENFFIRQDITIVTKERMRQLLELEKTAISSIGMEIVNLKVVDPI